MKKIAITLATAALAFTLAGCGAANDQKSGVVAGDAEATGEEAQQETVVQGEIAWSDSEDAAAAAESAGLTTGFEIPTPLPIGEYEWSAPTFMAMDKVVEAHSDGGGISCSIRKGEGVSLEDLSADLNEYKFDWTQDVDGIQVACHGYEEGIANFLEWEANGCSYDVWCMSTGEGNLGMNADEIYAMVTSIK